MSASIFLTQESLWPTLKELAEGCQQRKMVAVPYIGKDGAKPLKLNEGDVLICALTEANARKGLVCPDEIARLRRKGVRVYIQDHLHAKVYLIGRAAVVCSANLSQSSINNLDEAGLLITDLVCPHGKLLGKKSLTRISRPITYLYLEMPSKYSMINWEKFRSDCEQFGLRLPQNLISKEVTNSSNAQRIQLMASPETLQK